MTTGALLALERELAAQHLTSKAAIVEVTVDPGRDTPQRMAAYAKLTASAGPCSPHRRRRSPRCGTSSASTTRWSPKARLPASTGRPASPTPTTSTTPTDSSCSTRICASASSRPAWSGARACPSPYAGFSTPKASTTPSTLVVGAGPLTKPSTPSPGPCNDQDRNTRPTLFHQHGHRGKLRTPDQSEATMDRFRPYRDQIAFVAALVLPLGVAALLVPFRGDFASTASALILVAVIVAVAPWATASAASWPRWAPPCGSTSSSPSPTRGSPSHIVLTSRRRSASSWSGSSSPSSRRAIGTIGPAPSRKPTTSE